MGSEIWGSPWKFSYKEIINLIHGRLIEGKLTLTWCGWADEFFWLGSLNKDWWEREGCEFQKEQMMEQLKERRATKGINSRGNAWTKWEMLTAEDEGVRERENRGRGGWRWGVGEAPLLSPTKSVTTVHLHHVLTEKIEIAVSFAHVYLTWN